MSQNVQGFGFESQVQDRLRGLTGQGAVPVEPTFSTAAEGQGDVVYQGRRFLVTPHDADYDTYVAALQGAGLPYVENDPTLGTEQVVVGEISRDARLLPQIRLSVQPESGLNSRDVFYMFGRAVNRVIAANNLAPRPEDVSLRRTMILRAQAEILLTPPIRFEPLSEGTVGNIVDNLHNELTSRYEKFGIDALMRAFTEGLTNDRG